MGEPWKKYQSSSQSSPGPWSKYQDPKSDNSSEAVEPASSEPKSLFRTATDSILNNTLLGKVPLLQAIFNPGTVPAFGRGLAQGATFGTMGKSGLEGSVMEEHPTARKAGEFLGVGAPLAAAAMTGGAATGIGAAARGAGIFGQAIAEAAGTGVAFEGIKGAITGRAPVETMEKASETGLIFSGFGAAGQALGYLRRVLGNTWADGLANHFINTEKKIAEKLVEQGKPSLGKTYLEKTDLPGFKNRKEIWDATGNELSQLENRIRGKLGLDDIKPPVKQVGAIENDVFGVPMTKRGEMAPPAPIQRGSPDSIDLVQVAESLNPIKKKVGTGTEEAAERVLQGMGKKFLRRNGDATDKAGAMDLKRKFDDLAGDIYLKGADAKTNLKAEAYESMANNLRKQLYNLDPELGELAAQESLMIRIRVGLKPKVAERGGGAYNGYISRMVNILEGSPVSNLAAQGLKEGFGKPSVIFAPATKQTSRIFAGKRNE